MKLRPLPIASLALAATVSLTGCGHPNSSSGGTIANATNLPTPGFSHPLDTQVTQSTEPRPAVLDHFGDKCSQIPLEDKNPGSFAAMGDEAAATALSHNPLTGKFYEAIEAGNLVDTLNTAGNLTILAPDNEAFQKIPDSKLNEILHDKKELARLLTYHIIPKRLSPQDLKGTVRTLDGPNVVFKGDKPDITVGPTGTEAHVVCGNIITQNATVYVIDDVLQPPG